MHFLDQHCSYQGKIKKSNSMRESNDYSEGSEVSEYIPNHEHGESQARVKGAYELSLDSDKPDRNKDQMVYMQNNKNGV